MEKKNLTCIGCPMGCQITVEFEGEEVFSVTGNTCAIGDKYARQEVTHPERTVTSTIIVTGGEKERCSVKTKGNIPRKRSLTVWTPSTMSKHLHRSASAI
jgi:CxxC motif-containing protein